MSSVKKSLHFAIGKQTLTSFELQTVIFETANMLNDRPIGAHPNHPDDGFYLSPNNLLLGRSGNKMIPLRSPKQSSSRYSLVERVLQTFWVKWQRMYLPELSIYKKWRKCHRNVQAGDGRCNGGRC